MTTGAPPGTEDTFDLLISTDVLGEGMNLQQCRNVINLDLPWNPMRLVQRHGRIDRIGSAHTEVYLRTFFPDVQLDRMLRLEERVRIKLAHAAASVGVEDAPIETGSQGDQTFADTREEIEKLKREDATIFEDGGTAGATQTGEEYRQQLRKAIKESGDRIEQLPWRIGSGLRKGTRSGHFFCASVGKRIYLRFVPEVLDEPIVSEIGTCLRFIECSEDTPGELPEDARSEVYTAWDRAHTSIHEGWMLETDPANLQPRIRPLNRQIAEYLQENPPADIEQARLFKVLDSVETPWSRRDENQLREAWNSEFTSLTAKSVALVERIEEIGVEPFEPPTPLPPIEQKEVNLICWMALTAESSPERQAPWAATEQVNMNPEEQRALTD